MNVKFANSSIGILIDTKLDSDVNQQGLVMKVLVLPPAQPNGRVLISL